MIATVQIGVLLLVVIFVQICIQAINMRMHVFLPGCVCLNTPLLYSYERLYSLIRNLGL